MGRLKKKLALVADFLFLPVRYIGFFLYSERVYSVAGSPSQTDQDATEWRFAIRP
jgi:hypothetical protein